MTNRHHASAVPDWTKSPMTMEQEKQVLLSETGLVWVADDHSSPEIPLNNGSVVCQWLNLLHANVMPTITRDPTPQFFPVEGARLGLSDGVTAVELRFQNDVWSVVNLPTVPETDLWMDDRPQHAGTQWSEVLDALNERGTVQLRVTDAGSFGCVLDLAWSVLRWHAAGQWRAPLQDTLKHLLLPLCTHHQWNTPLVVKVSPFEPKWPEMLQVIRETRHPLQVFVELDRRFMQAWDSGEDLCEPGPDGSTSHFTALGRLHDLLALRVHHPLTLLHPSVRHRDARGHLPRHYTPYALDGFGTLTMEGEGVLHAGFDLDRYLDEASHLNEQALQADLRRVFHHLERQLYGGPCPDHLQHATASTRRLNVLPCLRKTVPAAVKDHALATFHEGCLKASQQMALKLGAYSLFCDLSGHIRHAPRRHLTVGSVAGHLPDSSPGLWDQGAFSPWPAQLSGSTPIPHLCSELQELWERGHVLVHIGAPHVNQHFPESILETMGADDISGTQDGGEFRNSLAPNTGAFQNAPAKTPPKHIKME